MQQNLVEFSIFSDILKKRGKITVLIEVGFWSVTEWTSDFIQLAETQNVLFNESWLWAFFKWRVLLGFGFDFNDGHFKFVARLAFCSDMYPH